MNARTPTVPTRGSISRIFVVGAGTLMGFVLGAAVALATTGTFAEGGHSALTYNPTGALHSHVLRENGAAASAPALVVDDALHEHVMRENRTR